MSASPDNPPAGVILHSLEDVEVARVEANPANPRSHFPEEELGRLAESIAKEGVLVPVVVYRENDHYRLVDGERRWLCAQRLGLSTIPAVITEEPDAEQNLVRMFNIHMVREAWQDMPTAWALGKLIEETGITSTRELEDLTGLSEERIKRFRHALELPSDYQDYINTGAIPLNFFWELKRNVIDPLAARRPALWEEFGDSEVIDAFVTKRLNRVITDTVSLRRVGGIIGVASRDVDDPRAPSILDDTLRQLIRDPEMSIDQAYEDSVEVIVETDKLERRSANIVKSFERLLHKARSDDERGYVARVGTDLVDRLRSLFQ